jgi:hypothetical protein
MLRPFAAGGRKASPERPKAKAKEKLPGVDPLLQFALIDVVQVIEGERQHTSAASPRGRG